MSPENLQKIEEIFLEAVEISGEIARTRFLDGACAGDVSLRCEVEKLIRQDENADDFMLRPLVEESGIHVFADFIEDDPLVGREVGKYKILNEIGEGGMGAVYLATRSDGSFEKRVAIKIVKRGMDTKFILRRFRQERQVLALLNHPFITPLLDGGTTPDGLPYFVMEFIEGKPLYKYADDEHLNITERLKLFLQICSAVEYAHQNKIVHRDLKPSNILIKPDGTPRLLDFGIAKVFNPEFQGDITNDPTLTAMRLMTPEYASPEQIKGETVSAASDIYSLGVVLFEFLTGHRPYRFNNRAAFEIARVICEEDPVLPSAEITRDDNFVSTGTGSRTLEGICRSRRSSPEELKKQLAGRLERIILKSLRKVPAERYESAAAFARDITNYLEDRPVTAENFTPSNTDEELIAPPSETEKYSIAILPLTVIGSSPDRDITDEKYLGIGLADALITRLSQVRSLLIRPTGSVIHFVNQSVDPVKAGAELKTGYILDGTLHKVSGRVRISIRLFDVTKNQTVWTENFDEDFTDLLELEDSISERVTKSLLPRLTGEEKKSLKKRGTDSHEAYEAYLRGRFYANQFADDALPNAVEAFREAIMFDPDYALPHVGIADFYVLSAIFGVMPPREAYPLAKAQLQQALRADNQLAEAYSLSAFVALLYDWNWTEAERLVGKAIEINPNYYLAHDVRAHILASQGISAEAVAEIEYAEALDPLSPRAKLMSSCIFYQTRRFGRGAEKAAEAVSMQPGSPAAFLHLGNSLTHNAGSEEAIEYLKSAAETWTASALPKYMLCHALVAAGRKTEAQKVLEEILTLAESTPVKPYFAGMACAALGRNDLAFEWFERAIIERDDWMIWFGTDIKLDNLRRDPRYFEILKQMNNPIISR